MTARKSGMMDRIAPALLALVLLIGGAGFPGAAHAQSASEIAAALRAIAQRNQALTAQEMTTAQRLGNPSLAADYQRRGLRRLETEMGTSAIGWISRQPHLAADIAAAAVAAAPEVQALVGQRLMTTFPGLASQISAATGIAPPPAFQPQPVRQVQFAPIRATATTASPPLYAAAPAPRPQFISPATSQAAAPPASVEDDLSALGIESISDPIEPVNRVIFAFNDALDLMIFRPVAAIYGFLAPDVVKSAVRRMFGNINQPVVFVNDLLQLDFTDAGVAAGRFAVNTTAGVLGIFDVAEAIGLEDHHADFGQTLHSYGLGAGPYIVLPLLGPSTARDAVGVGADSFFQPLTYILEPEVNLAITATNAITLRETLLKPLDDLRASSVDYYAALRAAYYQNRSVELRKGRAGDSSSVDALFDQTE